MQQLPTSALHRLLRITPGYAPEWLCSRDSCTGIDLLTAVPALPFLGAAVLSKLFGWWWVWLPVLPFMLLFMRYACLPFESRERAGRARRRRGECARCGRSGLEIGGICSGCQFQS
jgi:hypothetical protein